MFRPKGTLQGRTNVLGDKDRKALRNTFTSQFRHKTVEDFLSLLPPATPLTTFSLKGLPCEIYMAGEEPLFFVMSKKKTAQLFPTLQTLWKIPDLLPSVIVEAKTPPFLIRGADLMLPGCRPPPGGYAEAGMDLDQAWSVRIEQNPMPFAVGQVMMTRDDLAALDRGKILQVHHVLGDLLFKMNVPETMPEGLSAEQVLPVDEIETTEEVTQVEEQVARKESPVSSPVDTGVENQSASDGEKSSNSETEEESEGLESLIELCIIELIKRRWSEAQLPLDLSAIWGDIAKLVAVVVEKADEAKLAQWYDRRKVQPPTKHSLERFAAKTDLRMTGWRNLKKMANHFKKTKLWTTKEIRGQVSVVKLNRSHPLVSAYSSLLPDDAIQPVVDPAVKAEKKAKKEVAKQSTAPSGQLQSVVVYAITGQTRDIFASVGRSSNDGLMTEKMVEQNLQKYIDKLAAVAEGKEAVFPTMGGDEVKATDEALPTDVPWDVEIIMRDSKLSSLCLSKNDRNQIKNEGVKALKNVGQPQMLSKFIQQGMKPVTLLLRNLDDLTNALVSPQDFDTIEADAKITVSLQRTKRFIRTRVAGIHDFPMIDAKQLAEKLQKACAAAATLCEIDEVKGKAKPQGIVVQGSVVREVCNVLESQYGLPPGMVVATD